jgi:hypothetical protein
MVANAKTTMNGAAIGIARIFIKVYGADQTFVIWQ